MTARKFLFSLACITALHVTAGEDPVANLKKGQPKEVASLIDRLVGCNHWSGEEPYNSERKEEIARAITDLRCNNLAADEAAALRRYAKKPATIKVLRDARAKTY